MRRQELERRLLEFVAGMRPEADPPLAVGPGTALFEEGVVNSLRILDLIAFVEGMTGSKIPDAAVRLENFRSVSVIASSFASDAMDHGVEEEAGRVEPLRVFGRRSIRTRFTRPLDSLIARGELALKMPGRLRFRGRSRRLLEFFDSVVLAWARDAGGEEALVPPRLPRKVLARAGCSAGRTTLAASVVPPAVCYHVYHRHEGARLDAAPIVVSLRGRCLRDERALDLDGGRLRDFEMREIVILGTRDEVECFRQRMIDQVSDLVSDLDLEGLLEIANDPFFLVGTDPETRGRKLMQQVLPLKLELRLPLNDRGALCAVASFNHHLDFFGRRFRIRLGSGATVHTGCVAFGLERWTLAFLARYGLEDRAWPAPVQAFLAQEGVA